MARDIGHVERTNRGYICIRAKSGGIRSDFTQWGRARPKIYLGRMQIGAGFVRFFLNVWKLHSSRCTCDLSGAPLSRQGREISATYKNGKPIFFFIPCGCCDSRLLQSRAFCRYQICERNYLSNSRSSQRPTIFLLPPHPLFVCTLPIFTPDPPFSPYELSFRVLCKSQKLSINVYISGLAYINSIPPLLFITSHFTVSFFFFATHHHLRYTRSTVTPQRPILQHNSTTLFPPLSSLKPSHLRPP